VLPLYWTGDSYFLQKVVSCYYDAVILYDLLGGRRDIASRSRYLRSSAGVPLAAYKVLLESS